MQRRFEQRFGVPDGTRISLKEGVLTLAGTPPYEWLERVRREATLIAGVTSISDREAKVSYDRNLAMERFEARFGLPESANAMITNGVLTLSGEASHRWLTRVRAEAARLPGLTSIDDKAIIDLDARAFGQSDNIATEGFAALSRLPDELRRCQTAAKRIGLDVALDIYGYADAAGDEAKKRRPKSTAG